MRTDQRAHVVDKNLEGWFLEEFSGWDKISRGSIDPSEIHHGNKFNKCID